MLPYGGPDKPDILVTRPSGGMGISVDVLRNG